MPDDDAAPDPAWFHKSINTLTKTEMQEFRDWWREHAQQKHGGERPNRDPTDPSSR
jgi:hypothetical protein